MSSHAGARLAWSLCTLALLLVLGGPLPLFVVDHEALPYSLALGLVQACTAVIGALVASRMPDNAVGWILLLIGTTLGACTALDTYGTIGTTTAHGPLPGDELAAWLGTWTFGVIVFGGVMALLYLFPDGRFLSARWRRIAQASGVVVVASSLIEALIPGKLQDSSGIENPFAAHGWLADVVSIGRDITDPLALPVLGCAAAALVVRFRRSRGVERLQLKWISFAMVLVGVSLGLTVVAPGSAGMITFFLGLFALAAVPLAIGAAMLRYRLYDIDLVINRALVYGSLTALLAGSYLGSVLLLQLALDPVTRGSGLAVAASTLVTAALVRPARSRIQTAVDRRFFRRRYDAARTLADFGAGLRDEVDLDAVQGDLRRVVVDTMQPAHVAVWVRPQGAAR